MRAGGEAPLIAVLDYGIGNLRSAEKALEKVGANALLTADPAVIRTADGVVLPGVGAFGACMNALRSSGLDTEARDAVDRGQPFLGICVGMQMLYEQSAETPGTKGLGLLPGRIEWLAADVKRPQMQWNRLSVRGDDPLMRGLDGAWMYFVHSLAAVHGTGDETVVATVDYGGSVVAAVARENVRATQFHPEKSARAGMALLTNFLALCGGDVANAQSPTAEVG